MHNYAIEFVIIFIYDRLNCMSLIQTSRSQNILFWHRARVSIWKNFPSRTEAAWMAATVKRDWAFYRCFEFVSIYDSLAVRQFEKWSVKCGTLSYPQREKRINAISVFLSTLYEIIIFIYFFAISAIFYTMIEFKFRKELEHCKLKYCKYNFMQRFHTKVIIDLNKMSTVSQLERRTGGFTLCITFCFYNYSGWSDTLNHENLNHAVATRLLTKNKKKRKKKIKTRTTCSCFKGSFFLHGRYTRILMMLVTQRKQFH